MLLKFHHFNELLQELRDRIYEQVESSNKKNLQRTSCTVFQEVYNNMYRKLYFPDGISGDTLYRLFLSIMRGATLTAPPTISINICQGTTKLDMFKGIPIEHLIDVVTSLSKLFGNSDTQELYRWRDTTNGKMVQVEKVLPPAKGDKIPLTRYCCKYGNNKLLDQIGHRQSKERCAWHD